MYCYGGESKENSQGFILLCLTTLIIIFLKRQEMLHPTVDKGLETILLRL